VGEVWEADDAVLGRRVALKALVQELADDARATKRFVREARASAKLTHPNVTRVYDFGRAGGVPYLVMELLEGDTLADRQAGGPMPPAEAARICVSEPQSTVARSSITDSLPTPPRPRERAPMAASALVAGRSQLIGRPGAAGVRHIAGLGVERTLATIEPSPQP
jgi:Protein kinase domain